MTDVSVCLDFGSHTTKVLSNSRTLSIYPSCFIRHVTSGDVIAVGDRVTKMLGKLPSDVEAVFPVRNGQVVDTQGFEQFARAILQDFIPSNVLSFLKPMKVRAAILYPEHQTQRSVINHMLRQYSWREKLIPASEALWSVVRAQRLFTNQGCVIDIGGMTTKIYLFAEGQLSSSEVAEFGGDAWTADIMQMLRQECHLEVGWVTAESLKRTALHFGGKEQKHTVQGKDVVSGLPTTKVVSDHIFLPGAMRLVSRVITAFEEACQNAQPELVAKMLERGVYLTGGASQVAGLSSVLQETLKLPICLAKRPQEDVVRGVAEAETK